MTPIRVPAKADLEGPDSFLSPVHEPSSDIVDLQESNYSSRESRSSRESNYPPIESKYRSPLDQDESVAADLVQTMRVDTAPPSVEMPAQDEKPFIQAIEVSQKIILESLRENNAALANKRFRDYELGQEINRGGMGVIYSAKQRETGRAVAIKFMLQDESDPFLIKRFRQEAKALSKLIHPNIVSIVEFGEDHDIPFIVMELIDGITLEEKMRELKDPKTGAYQVSDDLVSTIFAPLSEALTLCHEHGIIHRDLKPDNIILEAKTLRPVLIDFGLVTYDPEHYTTRMTTFYENITGSDQLVGTPAFMSPEQIDAVAYGPITTASDVWSLLTCLFTFTTGSLPYDFKSLPELLMSLTSRPPDLPSTRDPSTAPWIDDLCRRGFHLDPSQRPNMRDLSKYLWAKRVPEDHQSTVVPAVSDTDADAPTRLETQQDAEPIDTGSQKGRRWGLVALLVVIIGMFSVVLFALGQRYYRQETLRKQYFKAFDSGDWRTASKTLGDLVLDDPGNPFYADQFVIVSGRLALLESREQVAEYQQRAKKSTDPKDQDELLALAFQRAGANFDLYSEVFQSTAEMARDLQLSGDPQSHKRFIKRLYESSEKGDRFTKLSLAQRLTLCDHVDLIKSSSAKTLRLYQSIVKQDASSWEASYAQGKIQEFRGRWQQAKGHYKSALSQNRRSLRALTALALLQFKSRDFVEAQALTQRALNLNKDHTDSLVLRAQIRMAQEDYLFAKEDLDRAIKANKGHARARGLLAQWFLEQKKPKEALAIANEALALDSACPEAYLAKAQYFVEVPKDMDKALSQCRLAALHAPKSPLTHYWRGRVYQERKQRDLAIQAYSDCLKLDPYHWRAYCNRGTLHRLARRFPQALSDLNQAIYLQPRNALVILQRSKILWIQLRAEKIDYTHDRWKVVIDELGKVLKINSRSASAYGRRAFLNRRRGKSQEAIADYDRAVALKTDDQYLWAGYRGLLYAELEDYEKAMADFNRYFEKAIPTHGLYNKIRKLRQQCQRKIEKRQ
ncbi:MAG: protein kinase [Planctomycetota bacterium]|nr:protein kinase [Planctomycetota bacterium]